MKNDPVFVPAVVAIIPRNHEILLVKRTRYPCIGLWGLPGGRIEPSEHLDHAARREALEETGLETHFDNLCGVVSELVVSQGQVVRSHLLHVCLLHRRTYVAFLCPKLKWRQISYQATAR